MDSYQVVNIFSERNAEIAVDWEKINKVSIENFSCAGIEEFSLPESSVDELLGKRAYSGGDVPDAVIDEVNEKGFSFGHGIYKYFFYENDALLFKNWLEDNYSELKVNIEKKENEDWNSTWRKHYRARKVSNNLAVIPEWERSLGAFPEVREKVLIYPGMGFGTGEHETTFLCLRLLDQLYTKKNMLKNCLDLGCGSGILGIAAIKLFKDMKVDFCDVDKAALDNCLQNIEINFMQENLLGNRLVIRERLKDDKQYDLIFANILEYILIEEKTFLLNCLKKEGDLLLSGILNEQVETILKEFSPLKCQSVISDGDWSAIHLSF